MFVATENMSTVYKRLLLLLMSKKFGIYFSFDRGTSKISKLAEITFRTKLFQLRSYNKLFLKILSESDAGLSGQVKVNQKQKMDFFA